MAKFLKGEGLSHLWDRIKSLTNSKMDTDGNNAESSVSMPATDNLSITSDVIDDSWVNAEVGFSLSDNLTYDTANVNLTRQSSYTGAGTIAVTPKAIDTTYHSMNVGDQPIRHFGFRLPQKVGATAWQLGTRYTGKIIGGFNNNDKLFFNQYIARGKKVYVVGVYDDIQTSKLIGTLPTELSLPTNYTDIRCLKVKNTLHVLFTRAGSSSYCETQYNNIHYIWNGTEFIQGLALPSVSSYYYVYSTSMAVFNGEIYLFIDYFKTDSDYVDNVHRLAIYKGGITSWTSVTVPTEIATLTEYSMPYTFLYPHSNGIYFIKNVPYNEASIAKLYNINNTTITTVINGIVNSEGTYIDDGYFAVIKNNILHVIYVGMTSRLVGTSYKYWYYNNHYGINLSDGTLTIYYKQSISNRSTRYDTTTSQNTTKKYTDYNIIFEIDDVLYNMNAYSGLQITRYDYMDDHQFHYVDDIINYSSTLPRPYRNVNYTYGTSDISERLFYLTALEDLNDSNIIYITDKINNPTLESYLENSSRTLTDTENVYKLEDVKLGDLSWDFYSSASGTPDVPNPVMPSSGIRNDRENYRVERVNDFYETDISGEANILCTRYDPQDDTSPWIYFIEFPFAFFSKIAPAANANMYGGNYLWVSLFGHDPSIEDGTDIMYRPPGFGKEFTVYVKSHLKNPTTKKTTLLTEMTNGRKLIGAKADQPDNAIIIGDNNIATAPGQVILGQYADPKEDDAFVVGNGSGPDFLSNLFSVDTRGNFRTNGAMIWAQGELRGVLIANSPYWFDLEDGASYIFFFSAKNISGNSFRGIEVQFVSNNWDPRDSGASTTAAGNGVGYNCQLGTAGTKGYSWSWVRKSYIHTDPGTGATYTRYHLCVGIGSCATSINCRFSIIKVMGSMEDFPK